MSEKWRLVLAQRALTAQEIIELFATPEQRRRFVERQIEGPPRIAAEAPAEISMRPGTVPSGWKPQP